MTVPINFDKINGNWFYITGDKFEISYVNNKEIWVKALSGNLLGIYDVCIEFNWKDETYNMTRIKKNNPTWITSWLAVDTKFDKCNAFSITIFVDFIRKSITDQILNNKFK